MKLRLLVAACLGLPLFASAIGDHTLSILAEHYDPENFVSTPSTPVLSPQGVSYWLERLPGDTGDQLNSSSGIVATETRTLSELGHWPVYYPMDALNGNLLNAGRWFIPGSSGGFNITPAIYENGATQLVYYGSTIPGITTTSQVQVVLGNYDQDGSVVFQAQRLAIGSDQFTAICRTTGSAITVLVKSGLTPIPGGSGGAKFSLVWGPTVNKGVVTFYGESGTRRGLYQFNGSSVTEVLSNSTKFPPTGTFPSVNSFSAIAYANDAMDVAVAFTDISGGVYKRVGGKWSTIAKTSTPIPDGVGNFFTFGSVAIHSGQVAFQGGRNNVFSPPVQSGIFIECGNGGYETVINLSDDFGEHSPTSLLTIFGGRWWHGNKMAIAGYSGNWRGVCDVTVAPAELTAYDDDIVIRTKTAATVIPVTANDRCRWGRNLTITGVTQGAHGKVALAGGVVRYTPAAGFAAAREDTFTYTITDSVTSVTGTVVVRNPFLEMTGTFNQVLHKADGQAIGNLTATLTFGGSISGSITVNGVKYTLKGLVKDDGTFTQSFPRKNLSNLNISLTFSPNEDGPPEVSGQVTGDFPAVYTFDPGAISLTAAPQELALANFNVLLPPDDNAANPRGFGYTKIKIAKTGAATFAGKLADGTAFTLSAPLRAGLTIPVYVPLYTAPKGELSGMLTFSAEAESDLAGVLAWRKPQQTKATVLYPSGFTASSLAVGARYTAPVAKTRALVYTNLVTAKADVYFTGAGITPLTIEADVSNADVFKALAPNANKVTLSLARSTGLVTGKFSPVLPGPAISFAGLVQPKQNRIGGHFPKAPAAGSLIVIPR
jgi:hypothetical protein